MHIIRVIASVLLFTLSWPGLSFSEFSHPEESPGQGAATGRPEMRDPQGFDQDRDREDTGNQGRPIHGTLGETKAARTVELPAPEKVDVQFGSGWSENGQLPVSKILTWTSEWCHHHARIAGFRVYQQGPGESHFSPYVTLYLKPDGLGIERLIQHTGEGAFVITDYGFSGWASLLEKRRILVVASRDFSQWTLGAYRHYIVPLDEAGREGPSSPIQACTLLEEVKILRPKASEVFNAQEVAGGKQHLIFEWSDIKTSLPGAVWGGGADLNLLTGPYGMYFLQLNEVRTAPPSNPRPGATPPPQSMNKGFFFGQDGTQWDYYYYGTSPKLVPGSDYHAQFVATYMSGRPEEKSLYGKCFAISDPVVFKVAQEPKPEPPTRTTGSTPSTPTPQSPVVRRDNPQIQVETPKLRQPEQCPVPNTQLAPAPRRDNPRPVTSPVNKARESQPPAPPQLQIRRDVPAPKATTSTPSKGRR